MSKINYIFAAGIPLSVIIAGIITFLVTNNLTVVLAGIVFSLLISVWLIIYILIVKHKLSLFTSGICQTIDNMLNSEDIPAAITIFENDTLFMKINHRLTRLYEITQKNRQRAIDEKTELESLLTDISHQVKTPISNIKMINATLVNENTSNEFLKIMMTQVDKLDFLIQAMIKTSRLESGMIQLKKDTNSIYETIAAALGDIIINADKKNIDIIVDCDDLIVPHDKKWTTEALFNIIDNAVKYTQNGGHITIMVTPLEMYTKIDINDNGKGIIESHYTEVFKRFYREEEVHDIEGIGIGLYLAREIITKQGGYIKLTSEFNKGSTFSIFLPNF